MSESGGSFWTSLSGILTGIAAVVTAAGGIYLGVIRDDKGAGPTAQSSSPATQPSQQSTQSPQSHGQPSDDSASTSISATYKKWPSIAEETFTNVSSSWMVGNWSYPDTATDLRITDGNYRWDFGFRQPNDRWVEAPYPSAVEFYVAVDVRLVESTIAGDVRLALLFGRASTKDYAFRISSNKFLGLSRYDGTNNSMIIDWTPVQVDVTKPNRLAVLVENQTIKLFLNSSLVGEYRDPTFTGGKVGLGLEGGGVGRAVVEFDNFEFRRKPR